MWSFSKLIPDHLRSTQTQIDRYLADTAQAKMFREGQANKRLEMQQEFRSFLPSESVSEYKTDPVQYYSLRKKFAAGALAAVTLLASGGQYAAAQHNRPSQSEAASSTIEENECYSSFIVKNEQTTTETFTIIDAGNDALTDVGKSKIQAEFEQSSAFEAAKESIDKLDTGADVSVDVAGMASDDNRQNINAGIGEKDEVNDRTARSYAAIATDALKKLFTSKDIAPTFTQSAEEQVLSAEQQQQLHKIQADEQSYSMADLLTAYNDVNSALSTDSRFAMNELIGQNRGVEITITATTPETVTENTVCLNDYMIPALSQVADPVMYGDPKVILPEWSRVSKKFQLPKKSKRQNTYEHPSLSTRLRRRANAIKQGLAQDVALFTEDAVYVGTGVKDSIADMGSEVGSSIRKHYDTWVRNKPEGETNYYGGYFEQPPTTRRERVLRPVKNTVEYAVEQVQVAQAQKRDKFQLKQSYRAHKKHNRTSLRQRISENLNDRVQAASKFAAIPAADVQNLSRGEFYTKHREFPEDVRAAQRRISTRLAKLVR
jgi:hypothetical protein